MAVEKEVINQSIDGLENVVIKSAKRGSNGNWSIDLLITVDLFLKDGRQLTTGNRLITIAAKQIGRKAPSAKKESKEEINERKAYE